MDFGCIGRNVDVVRKAWNTRCVLRLRELDMVVLVGRRRSSGVLVLLFGPTLVSVVSVTFE